ncbi:hypothetical protein DUI87_27273 [Hirundo rustica rustica]|uniref:C2H2-type domain-containing protein n=1 Tax=Hirundo rustica rustica TaxID=333673 RepID=A0A3M0J4B8_HIRRU|nr:hypothetical protein DUI87_27273 [Hirundo rustica rustica]
MILLPPSQLSLGVSSRCCQSSWGRARSGTAPAFPSRGHHPAGSSKVPLSGTPQLGAAPTFHALEMLQGKRPEPHPVVKLTRTTPQPTPSCRGRTEGISFPFPLARRQIHPLLVLPPPDKELSMETREDKSPRQILVEEAVLSSSTVQESNGEEQPLRFRRRRGCKGRSQGSEEKKPTLCQVDGWRLSQSSDLVVYEQLHDGENPHKYWSVGRASTRGSS